VYILEYMAHLSLQDWKAVGNDFVNLQFIAPGSMHPNDIPGLMDAVGGVLEVLMLGGGAKSLANIRVCFALMSLNVASPLVGITNDESHQEHSDNEHKKRCKSLLCKHLQLREVIGIEPHRNGSHVQDKNLLDNVGLDPGEMDSAGFMDGFATVRTDVVCGRQNKHAVVGNCLC
jgi:hypothetical protein